MIFPFYENLYIHKHWEFHGFSSTLYLRGGKDYGKSVFSLTFSVLCKFTFLIFWELYGFLLHPKYLRNPLLWNVVFAHTFPVLLEFTFPMFWGELYGFLLNLKCLCFPILFPYYGNPHFPCVGNCVDFCFKQKIPETLNFEMLVFSHIFSFLWGFTFLIFWELYVLMPHMRYVRNP